MIYRLTVQTLPDGLETQFTPPDTTQTVPSCLVWWGCELGTTIRSSSRETVTLRCNM